LLTPEVGVIEPKMYGPSARFGRIPTTIAGAARTFIARKGPWFLVNLLVFGALAIWLAFAIARSSGVFEQPYLYVRVIAFGYCIIFAYLSFVLERRGNARLLLHFAAACLCGELILRTMGSLGAGVKNDRPWREPRPYFMFGGPTHGRVNLLPAMDEGAGRAIRLSAEGFRTREIVTPKPADEMRIFFVGGSTVIGGYEVETTIPGVVEAHLHANGLTQARTYNFGVLSFVSGQELALLVHRLIDLKPDLVIAYDGGNDLYEPWVYDPRPGYPFNFVTEEEAMTALGNAEGNAKTLASVARDSALVQALLGTTEWFNRMTMRLDRIRATVDYGSTQWKEAVTNAYARNLAAMCRVARGNGMLFAGYFQPLLAYSQPLDANQAAATGDEAMVQALREQRDMALRAIGAQFPAPSAEAGCRFGDLSRVLENDAAAFTDAIHVDNKSNQVIGRRIAEDLLTWPALRAKRDARSAN
jgi:lysophospholipase L1-like esterase